MSTSDKHEATVRRFVQEVLNNGKLEIVDQLFTDDYVANDPVSPSRGRDGFRDVIRKYRTAFPDMRCEIQEMFSAGDRVVARLKYTGTHRNTLEGIPPTGRHVAVTEILIAQFAGDRIRETFANWDALGLMQQLGVVTLPGKAAAAGA